MIDANIDQIYEDAAERYGDYLEDVYGGERYDDAVDYRE